MKKGSLDWIVLLVFDGDIIVIPYERQERFQVSHSDLKSHRRREYLKTIPIQYYKSSTRRFKSSAFHSRSLLLLCSRLFTQSAQLGFNTPPPPPPKGQ
ncbi:hypothetical protein ACH5RR_004420 [Cinchona calisaya]|uniref:Uncharacterized protein n=1 Tax=Cinchona calisaya TaxID=153742 RepID=A0ABD3AXL4_9GENT